MTANSNLDIFQTRFHNPSIYAVRSRTRYRGKLTDFCVPANGYFPPPEMLELIQQNLRDIVKYYPDYQPVHQQCVAELCGIPAQNIVVANGVTEIITLLCRESRGPILTSVPTFGRWTDLPPDFGIPVHTVVRDKARDFYIGADDVIARARQTGAQTVVICNPNNPTGAWFTGEDVAQMVHELRHIQRLIIDESFISFSDLESAEALACESPNTVVVKSMGKSLGWHGIRLGYAVANSQAAHTLCTQVPYWNVNGLASFVLKNVGRFRTAYLDSFRKVARDRQYMYQRLQGVPGLRTWQSKANFLFSEVPPGINGKELRDVLLEDYGLLVRECSNKVGSTEQYLRSVVRARADADKLAAALTRVFAEAGAPGSERQREASCA
jgi:histidinol-phosphate/aromatic aminotransferase/cobyric acid decarboxylase-like protein